MQETTNYKFKKPNSNDYVNIEDLNYNADVLDKELKAIKDSIGLDTGVSVKETLQKIKNDTNAKTEKLQKEVQNKIDSIKLTADNVTIADNGNHFTSSNVEGALSELFTFADNGKKAWVDVIGNPLSNDDNFTTLKNKTQDIKNTLVDNLKNKKVNKTNNDSLLSLVNCIKEITSKYAHGETTTIKGKFEQNITINNLDFEPRVVVVKIGDTDSYKDFIHYYVYVGNPYYLFMQNIEENSYNLGLVQDTTKLFIVGGGFSFNLKLKSNSRIPFIIKWYAFE